MAGFSETGIALRSPRIAGIKMNDMGQQQRIGKSVGQMKLAAQLMGNRMIDTQTSLTECHSRER